MFIIVLLIIIFLFLFIPQFYFRKPRYFIKDNIFSMYITDTFVDKIKSYYHKQPQLSINLKEIETVYKDNTIKMKDGSTFNIPDLSFIDKKRKDEKHTGLKIAVISKKYKAYHDLFKDFFDSTVKDYTLSNYRHQTIQDIYFLEIESKEDLKIIKQLKKHESTLIYIIGPQDNDLIQFCLHEKTDLYLFKDEISLSLEKYEQLMKKQIRKHFAYYHFVRKNIEANIIISKISYIRFSKNEMIIYTPGGYIIDRKKTFDDRFIKVNQNMIVNKDQIKDIKDQYLYLKDGTRLKKDIS